MTKVLLTESTNSKPLSILINYRPTPLLLLKVACRDERISNGACRLATLLVLAAGDRGYVDYLLKNLSRDMGSKSSISSVKRYACELEAYGYVSPLHRVNRSNRWIIPILYYKIDDVVSDKLYNSIEELMRRSDACESSSRTTLKSMPYLDYLETDWWKGVRKKALMSAGYKCQVCSGVEGGLNVHHNTYVNRGNEKLTDLVVLCSECHSLFHGRIPSDCGGCHE